jgi:hypothetical protein
VFAAEMKACKDFDIKSCYYCNKDQLNNCFIAQNKRDIELSSKEYIKEMILLMLNTQGIDTIWYFTTIKNYFPNHAAMLDKILLLK